MFSSGIHRFEAGVKVSTIDLTGVLILFFFFLFCIIIIGDDDIFLSASSLLALASLKLLGVWHRLPFLK